MSTNVVTAQDVAPRRDEGDTAEMRVTFDESRGSRRLEQRLIRFGPGRSKPRGPGARQEILYADSGTGTLHLAGSAHPLAAGTAAYVLPGETYEIENPGPEPLVVVSVLAPAEEAAERTRVTVRFADREEQSADEHRSFRLLVADDVGSRDVTQFVGIVRPSRAPDHSHPYDEVGYVVEGTGVAHIGDEHTPIGDGSCFHLPPDTAHCIENTGPGVMRIMGVFHPAGSPKQRSYQAAS